MNIVRSKKFMACLHGWSDPDLQAVAAAMTAALSTFGQPHLHAGRGIRQVKPGVYETRVGLSRRLVFIREHDTLLFDFAGNHDQVCAYLKNRR